MNTISLFSTTKKKLLLYLLYINNSLSLFIHFLFLIIYVNYFEVDIVDGNILKRIMERKVGYSCSGLPFFDSGSTGTDPDNLSFINNVNNDMEMYMSSKRSKVYVIYSAEDHLEMEIYNDDALGFFLYRTTLVSILSNLHLSI